MDWLYKISITCFTASYLLVMGLEVARIFFDVRLRFIRVGLAAAGLFAHTVFLVAQGLLEFDSTGIWLSSWFGWCLGAAWVLTVAYVWMSLRQPKSATGLFLVPVILVLIAVGIQFGSKNEFSVVGAKRVSNIVHGSSLLLGTAVVALGFVFGMVYLIQAHRLKMKLATSQRFRLPSLEWLQRSSERSLIVSTVLLAIGLVSGISINWINQVQGNPTGGGTIAWSDPVIWSSSILFLWLLTVSVFNTFYQPARRGRKVAYLVLTSFLFLVLELGIVWWAGHAVPAISKDPPAPSSSIQPSTSHWRTAVRTPALGLGSHFWQRNDRQDHQ